MRPTLWDMYFITLIPSLLRRVKRVLTVIKIVRRIREKNLISPLLRLVRIQFSSIYGTYNSIVCCAIALRVENVKQRMSIQKKSLTFQ